jgi:DNA-binding transcriptional LysR family regulator
MTKSNGLPTIKALRCFIAVANTMSFSRAAATLSISQSAVSKQITALEQQLGQPLFYRHANGITLSEAGKRYLPKVVEATQLLQHSTANILQTDQQRDLLTVNVTPSFASLWLIEKIDTFSQRHPHIQINIKTGDGPISHDDGDHDLSIRCLPLSQHHDNAQLLCREKLLLVASPSLLKQSPIRDIEHLSRHTLLPQVTRPQLWEQFKNEQDLNKDTHYHRVGYEHFFMSLAAVKEGLGIALLPDFMVKPAQRKGELVNPLELSMISHFGYYLSIPRYKRSAAKIDAFAQWLGEYFKENQVLD